MGHAATEKLAKQYQIHGSGNVRYWPVAKAQNQVMGSKR